MIEAIDGDEAVMAFEQAEDPPRLAVLDYDLPKRSGDAVLAAIREKHPQIPALIVTGSLDFCADDIPAESILQLDKPFTIDEFMHAVEHLLTPQQTS